MVATPRTRRRVRPMFGSDGKPKRRKVTKNDARTIWLCFCEFGSGHALILGQQMGFRRSTIYRIIQHEGIIPGRWVCPARTLKWTKEQIETVVAHIEENPAETL
jgi:hypothetical protein